MKKKWAVYLSILILILNFVPSLIQGSKVFADDSKIHKENVELIKQENFEVSYDMRELSDKYYWEIHYQIKEESSDKELKLKFQFEHDQNINIEPQESLENTNQDLLITDFKKEDKGLIKITSEKSITQLSVKIQADIKESQDENQTIKEDTLSEEIGKTYNLFIPESEKTDESSTIDSEEAKESSSLEPSTEIDNSTEAKEEGQDETENVDKNSTTVANYPSNFGVKAAVTSKLKDYTNILPEYTSNDTGVFPTYSWNPSGNTTVRNHQGKKVGASQWDGLTTWDGSATNKTNSYIE